MLVLLLLSVVVRPLPLRASEQPDVTAAMLLSSQPSVPSVHALSLRIVSSSPPPSSSATALAPCADVNASHLTVSFVNGRFDVLGLPLLPEARPTVPGVTVTLYLRSPLPPTASSLYLPSYASSVSAQQWLTQRCLDAISSVFEIAISDGATRHGFQTHHSNGGGLYALRLALPASRWSRHHGRRISELLLLAPPSASDHRNGSRRGPAIWAPVFSTSPDTCAAAAAAAEAGRSPQRNRNSNAAREKERTEPQRNRNSNAAREKERTEQEGTEGGGGDWDRVSSGVYSSSRGHQLWNFTRITSHPAVRLCPTAQLCSGSATSHDRKEAHVKNKDHLNRCHCGVEVEVERSLDTLGGAAAAALATAWQVTVPLSQPSPVGPSAGTTARSSSSSSFPSSSPSSVVPHGRAWELIVSVAAHRARAADFDSPAALLLLAAAGGDPAHLRGGGDSDSAPPPTCTTTAASGVEGSASDRLFKSRRNQCVVDVPLFSPYLVKSLPLRSTPDAKADSACARVAPLISRTTPPSPARRCRSGDVGDVVERVEQHDRVETGGSVCPCDCSGRGRAASLRSLRSRGAGALQWYARFSGPLLLSAATLDVGAGDSERNDSDDSHCSGRTSLVQPSAPSLLIAAPAVLVRSPGNLFGSVDATFVAAVPAAVSVVFTSLVPARYFDILSASVRITVRVAALGVCSGSILLERLPSASYSEEIRVVTLPWNNSAGTTAAGTRNVGESHEEQFAHSVASCVACGALTRDQCPVYVVTVHYVRPTPLIPGPDATARVSVTLTAEAMTPGAPVLEWDDPPPFLHVSFAAVLPRRVLPLGHMLPDHHRPVPLSPPCWRLLDSFQYHTFASPRLEDVCGSVGAAIPLPYADFSQSYNNLLIGIAISVAAVLVQLRAGHRGLLHRLRSRLRRQNRKPDVKMD